MPSKVPRTESRLSVRVAVAVPEPVMPDVALATGTGDSRALNIGSSADAGGAKIVVAKRAASIDRLVMRHSPDSQLRLSNDRGLAAFPRLRDHRSEAVHEADTQADATAVRSPNERA